MNLRRQTQHPTLLVAKISTICFILIRIAGASKDGFPAANAVPISDATSTPTTTTTTTTTTSTSSSPPLLPSLPSQVSSFLAPLPNQQSTPSTTALGNSEAVTTSSRPFRSYPPLSPRRHRRRRSPLWTIPFLASAASFVTFKRTSRTFHGLVQWMSGNTWIPKTFKELNLQANVVTQVINGPVITSISVLFASLVSMTMSSLYQRQADIRLCLTNEIQALRILQTILSHTSSTTMEDQHLVQAQEHLQQYILYFIEEINSRGMKGSSSSLKHRNDQSTGADDEEDDNVEPPPALLALLSWCQKDPSPQSLESQQQVEPPQSATSSPTGATSEWQRSNGYHQLLHAHVSDWVCRLWSERSHRRLAWTSTFPMVHYVTLTFLAVGIGIAFLVATDQSTSIFLEGLPVRILWSILMGSFTALAVVCYDLSVPFGGAYQVITTASPWI